MFSRIKNSVNKCFYVSTAPVRYVMNSFVGNLIMSTFLAGTTAVSIPVVSQYLREKDWVDLGDGVEQGLTIGGAIFILGFYMNYYYNLQRVQAAQIDEVQRHAEDLASHAEVQVALCEALAAIHEKIDAVSVIEAKKSDLVPSNNKAKQQLKIAAEAVLNYKKRSEGWTTIVLRDGHPLGRDGLPPLTRQESISHRSLPSSGLFAFSPQRSGSGLSQALLNEPPASEMSEITVVPRNGGSPRQ